MNFPRALLHEPLTAEQEQAWGNFAAWPDATFFPSFVGLVVEEPRQDYARMRLPYRPELDQPHGLVHGGAIATLIDTVVVPAIGAAYPDRRPFATIDMQIRYLAAVVRQDIVAEGWVTRRGRSIVFLDVEVTLPGGDVCATATLTYKVGRPPTGSRPDAEPTRTE